MFDSVRVALLAACVAVAAGCAPMQYVPIDVGPAPVEVYVDGERVAEPLPEQLDLESDRGHVVMIKKDGHRAQQVILRSVEQPDGPPRLEPDALVVELRPETPKGRRLEVELDDETPSDGASTPAAPDGASSPH
ncbi:MAG: hypothetical protein OEV20_03410 [Actinomycetota bacterium]|nr:hypothetical protein [Actinomycetota bacterium]